MSISWLEMVVKLYKFLKRIKARQNLQIKSQGVNEIAEQIMTNLTTSFLSLEHTWWMESIDSQKLDSRLHIHVKACTAPPKKIEQ